MMTLTFDLEKTDAVTPQPKHKQLTAVSIRRVMRKRRDERLQVLPCQGKAMNLVSKSTSSAHFIRSGTYTRFVDWRFIHRARLDILPINGKPWVEAKGCRRCGHEFESLLHTLNGCQPAKHNMTRRHNDIVERIKTAVGNPRTGCELLYDNQTIPGSNTSERPDLVIKKGNDIFVEMSQFRSRTAQRPSRKPDRRRSKSTAT